MTTQTGYYPLRTVGTYVAKTVTPEMPASGMAWLGEAPTAHQAERYEGRRAAILREELARVTAAHSLAEGVGRARFAGEMNGYLREIGGAL